MLSDEDNSQDRVSNGRCHGNHICDQNCHNWLCVKDSNQTIGYGLGLSADIADTMHQKDVAMATTSMAFDRL